MRTHTKHSGFTLIELLLAMGIIAVLFSIASILMLNLIPKATLSSLSEVLIAELKNQQLRAMAGDASVSGSIQDFGFHISGQQYTLFRGSVYDSQITDNFAVAIEDPITLETTFANQQIVFDSGSGEILNFIDGQDTVTLRNTQSGETIILELNRYGVITAFN